MNAKLLRPRPTCVAALFAIASLCAAPACGGDPVPPGGDDTAGGGDILVTNDTRVPVDSGGGGNRAPELERIGDRAVGVGQPLVIVVAAKDADGDTLTYSVFGALPPGARFDKAAHRFEWTPDAVGATVFLTFVVSDGAEFDRETVRIEVSADGGAHPPAFIKVGDQQLTVGRPFALALTATDPDGDPLRFGADGALPAGSSLDPATGAFAWTPTADAVGTARVTFTVSDGALTDTMPVRLVVGDGQVGGPEPPVVAAVAPQTVAVGQPLAFTLSATDANGDALTWAIDSGAPAGAQLNDATFSWTPAATDAGKAYSVTFSVTDGTFTVLATVKINVSAGGGSCTPDANEPNEDFGTATLITAGTVQRSICESTQGVYDDDVYRVAVPAGSQLAVELAFDAAVADLDLYVLDPSEQVLAASEQATSPEQVAVVELGGRDLYVAVVGFGDAPIKLGYTLTVTIGPAPTDLCVDDAHEPNDTPAAAKAVPTSGALQICANDRDYWKFAVACGQRVEVLMDITADGGGDDLDMRLYDSASASGTPVAVAETEDSLEALEVSAAAKPGTWVLEVYGYEAADEASYELLVDATGGCQDDGANNPSAATADAISGPSGFATGLALCCADDWFKLPLAAGEQLTATADIGAQGAVGLRVMGPDGVSQLAAKAATASGVQLQYTASTAGTYFVVATGAVGTSYALSWSVTAAGACTVLSCDTYTVCDAASGTCVTDWCASASACPDGFACTETYCANACTDDSECRSGYACKHFAGTSRCGIVGTGGAGAGCSDHTECAGALICSTGKKCQ